MSNSLIAALLSNPKLSVKMFLDYRKYRGLDEFRIRPRLRRQGGMQVINVFARNGTFGANILLRPNTSDLETFEQTFLAANYNVRRLPRYQDILAEYKSLREPLILDLGANIGLTSLYFQISWPKARIIAVEPDIGNVRLLRRNATRAVILHAAIASEMCRAAISNPEAPAWAYRTKQADDGTIEGITVAEILAANATCQPFICKIDIEGAETDLFSKNTQWVSLFPIIIIEPHDWLFCRQATARNFLRAISGLDRDFFILDGSVWSISNNLPTDSLNLVTNRQN
jgi:FkbM family methyltransferase